MILVTGKKGQIVHLALQIKNVNSSEHGAALVIALIIMSMLSLLTIASFDMLSINVQIAGNHERELKAKYIADAGVEDAIDRLRDNPLWDAGLADIEFPTGSGNTYTVAIDNSEYPSITITSTGTMSSFQRSLEVQVGVTGSSAPYTVKTVYWKEI